MNLSETSLGALGFLRPTLGRVVSKTSIHLGPSGLSPLVLVLLIASTPGCSSCKQRLLQTLESPSGDFRAEVVARNCGMISGLVVRTGPAQSDTVDDVFLGLIPARGHDAGSAMWAGTVVLEWAEDTRLVVVHASVLSPALQTVQIGRLSIEYRPVDSMNPPLPATP